MARPINTRFIRFFLRSFIVILALTAIVLTVVSLLPPALLFRLVALWASRPPDPTPPPPTILAPRGELPPGAVGLEEWIQYRGESYNPVGSGFLLRLSNGEIVGVTTAHSMSLGDPQHPLERVAFGIAGHTGYVAEFDTLRGDPGQPRTGADLTVDYVLLQATGAVDSNLALAPDPRGAPQPGERVTLFSGLGDGRGGRRELGGTAQSVDPSAVWVLMDEAFEAGLMSGSPVISQHSGQVVGMAIAVSLRGNRVMIGCHPIGSIVRLTESAGKYAKLARYRR